MSATLEESFIELRTRNTKYSFEVLELKKELKLKNEWVKLHQRNLEFAVEKRNAVQDENEKLKLININLENDISNLKKQMHVDSSWLELSEEFVKDCSVSHVESRYKYRAKLLMSKSTGSKYSDSSECLGCAKEKSSVDGHKCLIHYRPTEV